jgi:hypothetical protein
MGRPLHAFTPTRPRACEGTKQMHRPWEKHLRLAVVLLAVAFAVAEFWNVMAGSAIVAVAVFVALRPLFRRQPGANE